MIREGRTWLAPRVYVDENSVPIRPVPRRLVVGKDILPIERVACLDGGMIVGEGDSGKSTYACMLCEAARQYGPSDVRCLRDDSVDFSVPEPPGGQVATVVFDGLDERPESWRKIAAAFSDVDPKRCRVWVTSRACSAAFRLKDFGPFGLLCELEKFSRGDARALADAAGFDGAAFVEAISMRKYDSFIAKPGGVVALLQLYSTGDFECLSTEELMGRLALKLVFVSRDGCELGADETPFGTDSIQAAAEWTAVCLKLAGKRGVWIGPPSMRKNYDVTVDEIARGRCGRSEILAILGSRMFEPLSPTRLRIGYSDMQDYLAARWISRHMSAEDFSRLVFWEGKDLCVLHPLVLWACRFRPELGQAFVPVNPILFFNNPRVIELYGFERYLKSVVKWCRGRKRIMFRFLRAWMLDQTGDSQAFAEWLTEKFDDLAVDDVTFLSAAALLIGNTYDYPRAARTVLGGLGRLRSVDAKNVEKAASDLLVSLCEQCRFHDPFLAGRPSVRLDELLGDAVDSDEVVSAADRIDIHAVSSADFIPPQMMDYLPCETMPEDFTRWCAALNGDGDLLWTVDELVAFDAKEAVSPSRPAAVCEVGGSTGAKATVRGPKNTKHMQLQREVLAAYADEKGVLVSALTVKDSTYVWNLPKNKSKWDAWAKRADSSRGYPAPQNLLNATKHADEQARKRRGRIFSVKN